MLVESGTERETKRITHKYKLSLPITFPNLRVFAIGGLAGKPSRRARVDMRGISYVIGRCSQIPRHPWTILRRWRCLMYAGGGGGGRGGECQPVLQCLASPARHPHPTGTLQTSHRPISPPRLTLTPTMVPGRALRLCGDLAPRCHSPSLPFSSFSHPPPPSSFSFNHSSFLSLLSHSSLPSPSFPSSSSF